MTKSPIIVDGMRYSSLDGSSSKDDIKAFQKWVYYVKKDSSISTARQRDGVDGIFGKKTSAAWTKYGDEYTKLVESATPKPNNLVSEQPAPEQPAPEQPAPSVEEQKKEGWWKRQSKRNKTLIIGGAALLVGLAIYYAARNKKGAVKKAKK